MLEGLFTDVTVKSIYSQKGKPRALRKMWNKSIENKPWIQKDGTKISVLDMTDEHINNTIKLMEKNKNSIGNDVLCHNELHKHLTLDDLVYKSYCDEWIIVFKTELEFRKAGV